MKTLVDTSVWSLAFRKKVISEYDAKIIDELKRIIRNIDIVMIGPIRQEILSGISEIQKYEELKVKLSIFPDYAIETENYELAACYFNECRKNGIQGSHVDFLICSVSTSNNFEIFTLDKDFINYSSVIKMNLKKVDFC
jgi:predicted nucleic acid-binding protein